jgi:hypothetical protein
MKASGKPLMFTYRRENLRSPAAGKGDETMFTVIAYLPNGSLEARPVPDMTDATDLAMKWSLDKVRVVTITRAKDRSACCVYQKGTKILCPCEDVSVPNLADQNIPGAVITTIGSS